MTEFVAQNGNDLVLRADFLGVDIVCLKETYYMSKRDLLDE
jgi:hypothetical protein